MNFSLMCSLVASISRGRREARQHWDTFQRAHRNPQPELRVNIQGIPEAVARLLLSGPWVSPLLVLLQALKPSGGLHSDYTVDFRIPQVTRDLLQIYIPAIRIISESLLEAKKVVCYLRFPEPTGRDRTPCRVPGGTIPAPAEAGEDGDAC